MERKKMISSFVNIKTSLWIWLVAESILLSACGSESSNRETEERQDFPIEEMVTENSEVNKEEIVEVEPEEKNASANYSHKKGEFDEYGEQYSLVETEDGEYVITLYDKENNVVHTETYSKLPWCAEMTDNILQIGLTGGNISSLIFYYDKERAIVSPFYTESFYLRDNYVAYMKDESTLVLTDIFKDGELYMEVSRNFSDSRQWGGMWISIKDITMITLNGLDVVVLEYYEGEDRELISDIIPLDKEGEELVFNELEEIERNYEILEYDICSPVLYDFENTNLAIIKFIELKVSINEELSQKYGKELKITMDYHTFDFDDDGSDDYLVCIERELYDGRVEHWIEIYVTRHGSGWVWDGHEKEMVEDVPYECLELNLPLYNQVEENGHKQVMVLDEQVNGYYTIVLPESNLILRYNDRYNKYVFCDQ